MQGSRLARRLVRRSGSIELTEVLGEVGSFSEGGTCRAVLSDVAA
jgi:hypothetical protein